MKTLTLLLLFTLLFAKFGLSQKVGCDIFVNGQNKERSLSKSKENFLTVKGYGCDRFELKERGGATLVVKKDGYVAVTTIGKSAVIDIIGIQGEKRIYLGTMEFSIVE